MMRQHAASFVLCLALVAAAQGPQEKISVDLEKAEAAHAFGVILGDKASYVVRPGVYGTILQKLSGVTREAALRNAAAQVDATTHHARGIYEIIPNVPPSGRPIDEVVVPSFVMTGVELRDALWALFRASGTSYSVDPTLQGSVTLNYQKQPFESALRGILDQVGATYREEAGIYVIVPNRTVPTGITYNPDRFRDTSLVVRQEPPPPPVMVVDGRHLYILRGSQLLKIDKEQMKVVKALDLRMP